MRKVQAFFLKNSREIGGKGSIPSRRHPMGVGGLYNPRTCRAGPACPAARSELLPAGHMGPALQSTVAAQGGQSRPPLQNSREIGAKRDINEARERLTPLSDCQKNCPVTSIGGKDSVKGNRQGSLSRSITRRSDQNRKIKYCFLFCDFASACQKSPFGLF